MVLEGGSMQRQVVLFQQREIDDINEKRNRTKTALTDDFTAIANRFKRDTRLLPRHFSNSAHKNRHH